MTTLKDRGTSMKERVEAMHCRRGPATGTTKRGAYWLATEPIEIRSYGGDGIGNSAVDCRHWLELRHYRSGEVSAVIFVRRWHQNGANPGDSYHGVDEILDCDYAECVIVLLKGMRVDTGYDMREHAYSDRFGPSLTAALTGLGLPACEPSPDETTTI